MPFWAVLIDDTPPYTAAPDDRAAVTVTESGAPSEPDTTPVASVDVVFADLTSAGAGIDGRLGMIAARALRRGGILAVLTRCRHPEPGGALLDSAGGVVASAQNADLLYLQHIIIPAQPLRRPRPAGSNTAQRAVDPLVGHAIAHVDLLVFAQPGHQHGGTRTDPSAEPVSSDAIATAPTGVPR